jgi:putative ABC transport system ATP-binding protein
VSLPSDNPVLDVRGLSYPADGSRLRQVDLAVGEGETVAVLGPAGAGKSALLACLSGAAVPAQGAIWTNGRPFHLLPASQKRAFRQRFIGLAHHRGTLLPELTVLANVALPLRFRGMRRAAAAELAQTWLDRFEIGDLGGRRARGLPVQGLRRAVLARAMVTEPLLLLADEPFEGLPEQDTEMLVRILRSTAMSHRTTVLAFTRDEAVAGRFERTIHLDAGRTSAEPVPQAAQQAANHAVRPAAAAVAIVTAVVPATSTAGVTR